MGDGEERELRGNGRSDAADDGGADERPDATRSLAEVGLDWYFEFDFRRMRAGLCALEASGDSVEPLRARLLEAVVAERPDAARLEALSSELLAGGDHEGALAGCVGDR